MYGYVIIQRHMTQLHASNTTGVLYNVHRNQYNNGFYQRYLKQILYYNCPIVFDYLFITFIKHIYLSVFSLARLCMAQSPVLTFTISYITLLTQISSIFSRVRCYNHECSVLKCPWGDHRFSHNCYRYEFHNSRQRGKYRITLLD